jgi:hypothetical protein
MRHKKMLIALVRREKVDAWGVSATASHNFADDTAIRGTITVVFLPAERERISCREEQ